MDNSVQEEKRKFKRVSIPDVKVNYKLLDPRTWSTYHEKFLNLVENISLGGLAVIGVTEMPLHAPVGVDINLGYGHDKVIKAFGRVAWIKKQQDNYMLGISFSWWKKEDDKKILFNLIQKRSA